MPVLPLLVALVLSASAKAVPAQDTGVPCEDVHVTALVPLDGSTGVSPDAVPAMVADADCGAGDVNVTLRPELGPADTLIVPVGATGVYWLTDLDLEPDTAYELAAAGADGDASVSHFTTGSGPIPTLAGAPTLTITGSRLAADTPVASVSLEFSLVPDPAGAVFTLRRDGAQIESGVEGPTTVVDSFGGTDGQEVCYVVTQLYGDGSFFAASPEACTTLVAAEEEDEEGKHGCATVGSPGAPSAPALIAVGLLLRARKRRNPPPLPPESPCSSPS